MTISLIERLKSKYKLRADGFAGLNARKEFCHAGHPFDATNTRVDYRGHRRCRACDTSRRRSRAAEMRQG